MRSFISYGTIVSKNHFPDHLNCNWDTILNRVILNQNTRKPLHYFASKYGIFLYPTTEGLFVGLEPSAIFSYFHQSDIKQITHLPNPTHSDKIVDFLSLMKVYGLPQSYYIYSMLLEEY